MAPRVALLACVLLPSPPQDVRDRFFPVNPELAPWFTAELGKLDPAADGWPTEALHDRAEPVLERFLAAALSAGAGAAELESLLAADFEGATELRPGTLEVIASKGSFEVRRPPSLDATKKPREALAESVAALRKTFAGAARPEFEAEVTALEPSDEIHFATRAEVRAWASVGEARVALNFDWDVGWTASGAREEPRVRSLALVRFEQVIAARAPFADLTGWTVGKSAGFAEHFLRGVDDYHLRNDHLTGNALIGGQGLALGDVDGDGRDDLYVPMQAGIPNRLFVHAPAGDTIERAAESGVAFLDNTRSALFADFDDDGDQDLAVALGAHVAVLWNRGRGEFSEPTWLLGEGTDEIFSLAAGDGDGDGDLDLFACRYVSGSMVGVVPLPYYDAQNGATNYYWRNDQRHTFTNATEEAGFGQNGRRYSLAALWDDFDDDGDPDLYVANDFGRDNLYVNDGRGRFVDRADELGANDIGASMGLTRADVELDGDLDLYVSDMWSAPGRRITARAGRFQSGSPEAVRAAYRHHARGNVLYLAESGRFVDAGVSAGVARGGWSWGALFTDLENDGLPDLYVPNGFLTWPAEADLEGYFWRRVIGGSPDDATPSESYRHAWATLQILSSNERWSYNGHERNCVYLNVGGGRFADATAASGVDFLQDSRAVARCDWDGDGREDLWLKSRTAPRLRFLHNRALRSGHWLGIDLVGRTCSRDAIGARVTVEAGGRKLVRTLYAGEGYLAQSSKRLHFGLGDATEIERVQVRWPWGKTETFAGPPVDGVVRILQGEPDPKPVLPPEQKPATPSLPHDPPVAPHEKVVRIPLVEKLPLAALRIPSAADASRTVRDLADGRPLLLRIWTTRMAGDGAERLVAGSRLLSTVGARLVLLSADEGPALAKARKLVAGTELEADFGYLDGTSLETLEITLIEVFQRSDLVPLPLDLLLDPEGQLVLLYFRPLESDELAADLEVLSKLEVKGLATPKLLGGRWLQRPKRDYAELARLYEGLGNAGMAELYRAVADQRAKPAPADR